MRPCASERRLLMEAVTREDREKSRAGWSGSLCPASGAVFCPDPSSGLRPRGAGGRRPGQVPPDHSLWVIWEHSTSSTTPPLGGESRDLQSQRVRGQGGTVKTELGPVQWQIPCTPRTTSPAGLGSSGEGLGAKQGTWGSSSNGVETLGRGSRRTCPWGPGALSLGGGGVEPGADGQVFKHQAAPPAQVGRREFERCADPGLDLGGERLWHRPGQSHARGLQEWEVEPGPAQEERGGDGRGRSRCQPPVACPGACQSLAS